MTEPKVAVFFYGSFINPAVLAQCGLLPDQLEVARLPGFDICIQPLANLIRSDEHCAYGVLTTATHAELARLYDFARNQLGGTYLPQAVFVESRDGAWRPALCYIAPEMSPAPAAPDYVDRIVGPARTLGFPAAYIARLERFRS